MNSNLCLSWFYYFLMFLALIVPSFAQITIRSPKQLASQFNSQPLKIGLSNFGSIPYGHTIVGRVYYDTVNTTQILGCDGINISLPLNPKVDESPILMLNRGECSFVTKVINAQAANAHIALIIDNVENQNVNQVIMADDGRGMEVTIPAVLISYEDGAKIKRFYAENKDKPDVLEKIIWEVNFDMENKNNTVDYDIWYTPDQDTVYSLLGELYYYHVELKAYAKLHVHFVTYSHINYNENERKAMEHCLGSGKYCVRPGKYNIEDGAVVVKEIIKQKCIYNYSVEVNKESYFWDYLHNFYNKCIAENKFDATCSNYASKTSEIPNKIINQCIYDSYIATDNERKIENYEAIVPNKLLDEEYEKRQIMYINRSPSLFINGRLFWGSWRADNVFEGLCAGWIKKPEACYTYGGFERDKKMSGFTVGIIIILIVVANIFIFLICMRVIRRKIQERWDASDINRKIDTVVNSYLAMRETK